MRYVILFCVLGFTPCFNHTVDPYDISLFACKFFKGMFKGNCPEGIENLNLEDLYRRRHGVMKQDKSPRTALTTRTNAIILTSLTAGIPSTTTAPYSGEITSSLIAYQTTSIPSITNTQTMNKTMASLTTPVTTHPSTTTNKTMASLTTPVTTYPSTTTNKIFPPTTAIFLTNNPTKITTDKTTTIPSLTNRQTTSPTEKNAIIPATTNSPTTVSGTTNTLTTICTTTDSSTVPKISTPSTTSVSIKSLTTTVITTQPTTSTNLPPTSNTPPKPHSTILTTISAIRTSTTTKQSTWMPTTQLVSTPLKTNTQKTTLTTIPITTSSATASLTTPSTTSATSSSAASLNTHSETTQEACELFNKTNDMSVQEEFGLVQKTVWVDPDSCLIFCTLPTCHIAVWDNAGSFCLYLKDETYTTKFDSGSYVAVRYLNCSREETPF